jgi:transcription initiation factor TFIIF subunit beta
MQKTTAPTKPTKGKKTEFKAARIPENELLDRIFSCFRRYEYWGMKELKKELQQPEAYLRMVLEKVAELNKSGRFANKWSLQPGHRAVAPGEDGPVAEAAPDAGDMADDDDDGEDDEIKMEDVL